jgi:hypothetical protein
MLTNAILVSSNREDPFRKRSTMMNLQALTIALAAVCASSFTNQAAFVGNPVTGR